jgi:hypothetical protein
LDAEATAAARLWVDSALLESVVAAVSRLDDAAETAWTMTPTAASNPFASSCISARCEPAMALAAASFSAASRLARSIALVLNVSTACAISPISSLRPSPGRTTLKLPAARSFTPCAMPRIGLTTFRRTIQAPAPTPTSTTTRAAGVNRHAQAELLVRFARAASATASILDAIASSSTPTTPLLASNGPLTRSSAVVCEKLFVALTT